jgi:hypothetical protein
MAHRPIDLKVHDNNSSVPEVESLEERPYVTRVSHVDVNWIVYLKRVSEGEFPNFTKPRLDLSVILVQRTQVTFR